MTPDWYVDPLGRYEGRYFDGEQWTAQVKDRGRLVLDPDWDRPAAGDASATEEDPSDRDQPTFDKPGEAAVEPISTAAVLVEDTALSSGSMDFSQESPTRQVAVLETPDTTPVVEVPATVTDGIQSDDTVGDDDGSSNRRWLYVLGLAILALAILLILLPRLLGSDEVADTGDEPVASATEGTADTADDADEGALPATEADDAEATDDNADAAAPDPNDDAADAAEEPADPATADDPASTDTDDAATDDAATGDGQEPDEDTAAPEAEPGADAMNVGSLEILNAKPVLRDLAIWHESSLGERNITLGADAACWLGSIGEAVVQNAQCGPVASTPGAEPQFDLIPLRFEDVSDGVIQIRPVTDAVVIDAVLPNGLELIGPDGPVDPATLAPATANEPAPDTSEPDSPDADTGDADSGDESSEADAPAEDAAEDEESTPERGSRGGRAEGD